MALGRAPDLQELESLDRFATASEAGLAAPEPLVARLLGAATSTLDS